MRWTCKTFSALSLEELYAILALRAEVFVVEQECPYQDLDGKDQQALHLCAYDEANVLVAYTRILNKGISYPAYASIGRVITKATVRGTGLGYELMERSAEKLFEYYGPQSIKISAQAHLQNFYGKLGYVGVGEEYLEDDIPHRAMIRELSV